MFLFTLAPSPSQHDEIRRKPPNSQFLSQDEMKKSGTCLHPSGLSGGYQIDWFQSCLTQRAARNRGVIGISNWKRLKAAATGRAAGGLQPKRLQAGECNRISKALRRSKSETLREIMTSKSSHVCG